MATSVPVLVGLTPGVRVLVAGGTGTIGSGTVLALLKQGAKVVVATRFQEKFIQLQNSIPKQYLQDLSGVKADVSTEQGVRDALRDVTHAGGVRHVVASLGSWWQKGPLVEQSLQEFNEVMRERVASHFLLIKTFVPYLVKQGDSTYTIITGNAGYEYLLPGTSLFCLSSGARNTLAMVARSELKSSPCAFAEVLFRCSIRPQLDRSMSTREASIIGHDLAGSVVTSTMAARFRSKVVVSDREEAKALILEDSEIM